MDRLIKYCCLSIVAIGFSALGYADDATVEPKNDVIIEEKCPEGQTFDKELKACITAPTEVKTDKVEDVKPK
jgi:hypothetical protein